MKHAFKRNILIARFRSSLFLSNGISFHDLSASGAGNLNGQGGMQWAPLLINIAGAQTFRKVNLHDTHSPFTGYREKTQVKARVPRGPKKILLVDDESIMAQTMDSALRRFGYNVFCFTNSLEALADFKLHPAQFDLIITDLGMPDLEGDKLAEEVIHIRPDIPVILYTGYSSMGDAEAKSKGIRRFLVKPFSLMELRQAVRDVLLGIVRDRPEIEIKLIDAVEKMALHFKMVGCLAHVYSWPKGYF